jgi:hypothetical protein
MGLFDNLLNPLWSKVTKLPEEKQVSFSLVVTSYGYIRWQLKETIVDVINKTGQRGIKDISGQIIQISTISDDQLQRLINNFSLGLLNSINGIGDDPSKKLKFISTSKLAYMLIVPFQMDENHRTGQSKSIDPENNSYSKKPDEARTQVIASWMKILKINNPEFPRAINLSGFLTKWDECVRALIPGMLTGVSRTSNADIISRAKKDYSNMPNYIRGFFSELADRMASPDFRLSDQQKQKPAPSPNLFNSVVRDQGRDKIDLSKKGGGYIDLLASLFYVAAEDILTSEDKKVFSIWANLQTSYWGDEHKRAFAIAELHFLKDAKYKKIEIPPEIINAGELIPIDQLPPLEKPLSASIEAIFMKIYKPAELEVIPTPSVAESIPSKVKPFTAREPFVVNGLDFQSEIFTLGFADNQRELVIGVGDRVVIYDTKDIKNLTSVLPHGNNNDISFAGLVLNDIFCLSASWDEKIRLWDKKELDYIWTQEIYCNSKRSIAISSDRREALCVDSSSTLYRINLIDGTLINEFKYEGHGPEIVAIDPYGLYAVTSGEESWVSNPKTIAVVRSLEDGRITQSIDCIKKPVLFISITEDDKCILVDEDTIMVWDIKSSRFIGGMNPSSKVKCGARAPESNFLVVGCENGTFEIWDWIHSNRICTFRANTASINSIAITNDETRIYTGGSNGSLKGWSTIGSPNYL